MEFSGGSQVPRGKKDKLDFYRGLIEVNRPDITLSKCEEEQKTLEPVEMNIVQKRVITNKKEKKVEELECSPVNCVCWAGYNDFQDQFAYVDDLGSVCLWDLKKKKLISEKSVTSSILNTCALEQVNTKVLACGGLEARISLFSINLKEELGKISKIKDLTEHTGMITCCGFLDEKYFISGSNDSTVLLWDLNNTGHSLRQFVDHESEVTCLDVCEEDGNFIATGSGDTRVCVWDVRQKDPICRIFDESKHLINCVKFMQGRKTTVAAGDENGAIRLYDLRAIGKIGEYSTKETDVCTSLTFSRSGRLLFSAYKDCSILCWDTLTEKVLGKFPESHKKGITCLSISADGSHFFLQEKMVNSFFGLINNSINNSELQQ